MRPGIRSILHLILLLALAGAVGLRPVVAAAQDAAGSEAAVGSEKSEATPSEPESVEEEDAIVEEADEDEDLDFGDAYLDDEDDVDSPYSGVEEIRITGKASAGTTQAMPEAITSFDQGQMDAMGITDVDSLALNTPSLHVGQFGSQAVITLRGVGVENLTAIGDPGVGFEVDGIHQNRPSAANAEFYDLMAVNVTRGPAGSKGGMMTTGGRITMLSKPPDEDYDAFGDIQIGDYKQKKARGVVNVPILAEKLMSRATFTFEKRSGFQENVYTGVRNDDQDDAENLSFRGQLRSLLSNDSLELRGLFNYSKSGGKGPARHLLNKVPEDVGLAYLAAAEDGLSLNDRIVLDCPGPNVQACTQDNPRKTYLDETGFADNRQIGFHGILNWDMPFFADNAWLSDVRVGLVGGMTDTIQDNLFDIDQTQVPWAIFLQEREARQGSVEAFFERPDVERFEFKVGAVYFRESVDTDFCLDLLGDKVGQDLYGDQSLVNEYAAGYGHVGYRVADNLRVHGALRYNNSSKTADQENVEFKFPPSFFGKHASKCGQTLASLVKPSQVPKILIDGFTRSKQDESWDAVTYDLGFDWEVTDTSSISFNFATGFKPGGFLLGISDTVKRQKEAVAGATVYPAEEVTEYEINFKNQLFDRKLQVNLALFWTDYDPYQVCQLVGAVFDCDARGSAVSRGVEVEWIAQPFDGFAINGHFNFLDARVDDFTLADFAAELPDGSPDWSGVDLAGNHLAKSPTFAGSLGAQYEYDAGRFGIFTPRVQAQGQSRTFYRNFNRPRFSQDPFIKLDVSLDWLSENERYAIRFGVDNVADIDVINFIFVGPDSIGAPVSAAYLPPRFWSLRFAVNYTNDLF